MCDCESVFIVSFSFHWRCDCVIDCVSVLDFILSYFAFDY